MISTIISNEISTVYIINNSRNNLVSSSQIQGIVRFRIIPRPFIFKN